MSKHAKTIMLNIAYVAAAIAVVLGVWAIGAAIADSEFILPTIGDTFAAFDDVFRLRSFWSGLGGTMLRSTLGFFISVALAFVLLWLSLGFNGFRRVAEPIISTLRSLPAVAVTLVLALSVGGQGAPIVLGVLVIMPIMYSSARARIATVPRELTEVCRLCGASRWKTFTSLWLPTVAGGLPEILATAYSYNIKAVVGAEILAQTADSLGMLMKLSQMYLMTAMLIAFVVVAVVVSVVCEYIIRGVLKLALKKYCD